MGKKRRRIVVVQEDELQASPAAQKSAPPAAGSHYAVELGILKGPAGSRRSRKERERKMKGDKHGKKEKKENKLAGRDLGAGRRPLKQSVSSQQEQETLCIQVVQSTCCECGTFKLVRGTLEQRWSSELSMYGSVVYQLIALSGGVSGNTCLRIDACHFERAGSQLFDVQFLKSDCDCHSWCSGTLSANATGWHLALSDGNTLTVESKSSLDWLELARFDADLPYDTDCRLSIPRATLTSSVDAIAPGLPAELRAALGQAQVCGRGSLFFSGIAFARHLALSSLPVSSLLPHAAFLLNLDAAPFKTVNRWTPRSVMELLRRHGDTSSKPGFRPVYGNVQAKKYHTKGSISSSNEVLISRNMPCLACNMIPLDWSRVMTAMWNYAEQVYNGELALDCLAEIDRPEKLFAVDEEDGADADDETSGRQHSQSHALDRCYLHEVQASEALRLGCALAPSEELPNHCLNAIGQLQDKLGEWFAPFHESTPKFFGGDLGVCMAGHRDCVGIAQSCLQLRGYKLLLCDAGWTRSAVSECLTRTALFSTVEVANAASVASK